LNNDKEKTMNKFVLIAAILMSAFLFAGCPEDSDTDEMEDVAMEDSEVEDAVEDTDEPTDSVDEVSDTDKEDVEDALEDAVLEDVTLEVDAA
jgi:outer membrane murein-binding lipoprotein Lpp